MYNHNNQTFDGQSADQWNVIKPVYYMDENLRKENSIFISSDFNRDGKDDLFVYHEIWDDNDWQATDYDLYLSTKRGNGDQTFTKANLDQCSSISQWHYKLSVGDFNGDGLLDLLYTGARGDGNVSKMGQYILALYNESKGCFEMEYEGYYSEDGNEDSDSYDVLEVEIGDFNGDGKSDVLLVDARFHGIDKSGYRLFISNGSSLVYKSKSVLTVTAGNKFF